MELAGITLTQGQTDRALDQPHSHRERTITRNLEKTSPDTARQWPRSWGRRAIEYTLLMNANNRRVIFGCLAVLVVTGSAFRTLSSSSSSSSHSYSAPTTLGRSSTKRKWRHGDDVGTASSFTALHGKMWKRLEIEEGEIRGLGEGFRVVFVGLLVVLVI